MLRWFTDNQVASNLLMIAIILGGILSLPLLDREVMPGIPLDMIQVDIDYPGASPAEIEERICIRLEEAVHDLEGIKAIHAEAVAGRGGIIVEIAKGFNTERMLSDIKARVDALDTLPEDAEEPQIQEAPWSEDVIELVVSADTDETALREIAYRVRDSVARLAGVDEVEIQGLRDPEMAIEISEYTLLKFNLTFDDVVGAIRRSSINLPGGAIRTASGDIALRTYEQAYDAQDFAEIVLLKNPDGTRVKLGDVADIRDGFEEIDELSRFNGMRAAAIVVRVRNNPDVVAVNKAVRDYVESAKETLPPGVQLDFWLDRSEIFSSRANMLISSGLMGLGLVFLLLTLFLRPAVAIWVCVGIAISFLGALFVIPSTPISVNMMTLFAFVLVLGIVVDDAIIIGESIHVQVQRGLRGTEAAYVGASRVAKPVVFAAVTTMIAFSPTLFIEGAAAKITMPLSIVVIATLAFSLIEAFLILPSHLSHLKPIDESDAANAGRLANARRKVAKALSDFSQERYRPFVIKAIRSRYLTLSIFVALWLIIMSFVQGGWVKQTFYPLIPGENIIVSVTLSDGVSFASTQQVVNQIERGAESVRKHFIDERGDDVIKNVRTFARENNIQITMELVPSEERNLPIEQVSEKWREGIGFIPDTKSYTFNYHLIEREPPVKLGLTANDPAVLMAATAKVEDKLATYDGLFGINNSQRSARTEVLITARDSAENYQVDRDQLARQVRQGFFGEEVQRIPRGRDEVKVMVRYPEEARRSLEQINRMRIRVGEDVEVPIGSVANIAFEQGASAIRRLDRRRIVEVTAEADHEIADPHSIVTDIRDNYAPGLVKEFPGLEFLVKGEQDVASEFVFDLVRLTLMAFLCTFGLIAIAFRSYIQPAIVMSAVPFGLLGAIIGHLAFGVTMSMFSFMGVVAAAGVVINDNLVLIDRINQVREELLEKAGGQAVDMSEAVVHAAVSRFRPILLTSCTTFIGLLPIMFERSSQSEYLKPMTLSLGFGVAFASFVTLILVPSLYLIVEDARTGIARRRQRLFSTEVA